MGATSAGWAQKENLPPSGPIYSWKDYSELVFYGLQKVLQLLGVFMHGKREGHWGEINSDP